PKSSEVVYFIDCARSMALDRPLPRLEVVKRAIAGSGRLVTVSPSPRVSMYRFGEGLKATTNLGEIAPTDDATRLLEALNRLPSHFADGPPAGVVIFSDGRTSETAGFEEIATGYRRFGVPIHGFPVGGPVTGAMAL